MTLTLIQHTGEYRRYRAEDDRGYCEVSTYNHSRELSSFGGSVMPSKFPEYFEHVGPDKGLITWRSGPAFRADITLPE